MDGTDKAAILLLYLGPDATASVFEHLDDSEIKQISKSMAKLGHVPHSVIQDVVNEFTEMTNPETGIFSQGEEFVRKILEQTLGPQKAEMLLKEISSSSFGDMVDILANLDGKTIANFLSQEHPQTIAVILAKLRAKQTGEIIAMLPQELQAEVVMRIADVDQVSPEILEDIDEVIKRELTAMGGIQRYKVGGVEKVVDMFNYLDRSKEKQILDKLDVLNPPLAEVIRKHLFTFDDIFKLDDRSIQGIMRELSNDTLTLAMKTAPDQIKEKIFRNISSRAAEMIKEDLEVMGPVRLSDVEKAQGEIIKIVRRLEEEGKVVLAGRGGDDVLV
ncbi:flagellar motor switch protein FliG [Geobacter metallireducens RCH3]|uniref:Flagellar motor switch protein FliG n=1 Tax=Geobacter metallireducens (strain ATCC 53774 / DSM 7210 / GS-15) TaxID=269799 RepID=Q39QZ9_GEOMG|nr:MULTISPECIES: flagellar motor switch protein FliG [Geobacter]ABB33325.1 flagellar motor switch protein FliG [Geobacter metallireducens GS-15]EHP84716.1 flagellar motor switch protein FliG [Geobacter metallireducens RCH3]MBT1074840.1 flagellar motor switch protein FliG [Geobacter grbiciae]